MDHKIKKTSEHILQSEKGLVVNSHSFFSPVINSMEMKLTFQRIFHIPLSEFLPKEFVRWIGFVSSYLPKLGYVQWVTNPTPDLKTPSLKPTDVLCWALGTNPTRRLLLIK